MLNSQPIIDPLEEVRSSRQPINLLDVWLYDEIKPYLGNKILEVGSDHGNFVQHLLNKELIAGFKVEKQFYLNFIGVLGWFINGKILKQQVPPRGQLKLFNKIVPIIRWFEEKIRHPMGLSLVLIATLK